MGKNERKTGKYGRNQPKREENRQKWRKTSKNVEFYELSSAKLSFLFCRALISVLPRSHFCPAKIPFLSCRALISVLPSSHFCPAKLTNFSKGAPPSYTYGVLLTSMVKIINASELIWQLTPIHCWYGLRWKDTFPRYLTFVDNYLLEYLSNRANASSGGF